MLLLGRSGGNSLIDQISKYLVVHVMRVADQAQGIDVLPPLLVFKYGENRGINFGLFQGNSEAARLGADRYLVGHLCGRAFLGAAHGPDKTHADLRRSADWRCRWATWWTGCFMAMFWIS